MPYANHQGVRIYYQVQGKGFPLVLHHGITQSWEDWQDKGYTDILSHTYQLILLDARGHGASDKPHDSEAYALLLRVGDVTAVLDDLDISRAHFWGYSMGGWVGFGMAKYASDRLHKLIIGGAHPYAENMQHFREPMSQGIEGLTHFAETLFGQWLTPAGKQRLMSNDIEALMALAQDRPSIAEVLPTITMPCLLYSGDADSHYAEIQKCTKHIPDVTFAVLPHCDHFSAMAKSGAVIPHIMEFLGREI